MLPEFPWAFIFQGIDVIMRYPVGIFIEDGVVQITHLKLKIGIDDWFHLIVFLHQFKPELHGSLKL